MNYKVRSIAIVAFLSVLMAGCTNEPPKCSDEGTFTLVRQILVDQLGGREGVTDKELQANMKIEFPRASAFDEKIKKYSCEAKLIAGGSVELPITYESQLDDKNQHIVSLGGISRGDLMTLRNAIAKGIDESRAANGRTVSPAPNTTTKGPEKKLMGDKIDDNPNAKPNTQEDATNKASKKNWQDEGGYVHFPDGSISSGPID